MEYRLLNVGEIPTPICETGSETIADVGRRVALRGPAPRRLACNMATHPTRSAVKERYGTVVLRLTLFVPTPHRVMTLLGNAYLLARPCDPAFAAEGFVTNVLRIPVDRAGDRMSIRDAVGRFRHTHVFLRRLAITLATTPQCGTRAMPCLHSCGAVHGKRGLLLRDRAALHTTPRPVIHWL